MKKFYVFLMIFVFILSLKHGIAFASDECTENTCPIPITVEESSAIDTSSESQEIEEENTVEVNNKTKHKKEIKEETITSEAKIDKPSHEAVELEKITTEINGFFSNWEKAQNTHNISALKKMYADEYINTDGYNKEQLFRLITSTFANYPDLKTEYTVDKIIPGNNYASIYLSQNVTATTKTVSKITNDNGQYNAYLKTIIYLKKVNVDWKIYSEQTTYEFSTLAYGTAKGINAKIKVPQKVLSGADYCAGVKIDVPVDYNAIASINSTQLVEGFKLNGENFRQVASNESSLERVLKANVENNNEAVVVSIGFAQKTHDLFKKTKLDLSGLLMLMQRVDIIPVTSNFDIQTSKDGNKK